MKFGTIGAGTVALAFAREALATGHEVVLSSRRGPDDLAGKVAKLGRGASAATVEEAASLDYVLLAVPWRNVEAALQGLPAWNGRVLIDATNPSLRRVLSSSWPIWAATKQAKWWLRLRPVPGLSRRSIRSSPRASTKAL
jgi:predicted dinucleotide-binding enzyme